MRMQEPEQPEQRQQSGQEWQQLAKPEFGEYQAEYPSYEADQEQEREYSAGLAAEDYQAQKIYPQKQQRQRGKTIGIIAIFFSSLGFFVSLAGIILTSLILRYVHTEEVKLIGARIGLAGSILLMLVSIAIFVIAVVALALRATRGRRQARAVI